MANECNFSMKVKGEKRNILTFINELTPSYDYESDPIIKEGGPRHFTRIFNIEIDNESELENCKDDDITSVIIDGTCAWSVWSCMCKGPHTYYSSLKRDYGDKCVATNLEDETRLLNLEVEIFSDECGLCFQEHFLYNKGECIIEEERDYEEYYNEETDEYTCDGAFESWDFSI